MGCRQLADLLFEALHQSSAVLDQVLGFALGRTGALGVAPEVVANLIGKAIDVDRLGDVAVAAGDQCPLPVAPHRGRGDCDNGDALHLLVGPQAGGDLVAVQAADVDVHQDQIWTELLRSRQGADPVDRYRHFEALGLQHAPHQHGAGGVIFHVENARAPSPHPSSLIALQSAQHLA